MDNNSIPVALLNLEEDEIKVEEWKTHCITKVSSKEEDNKIKWEEKFGKWLEDTVEKFRTNILKQWYCSSCSEYHSYFTPKFQSKTNENYFSCYAGITRQDNLNIVSRKDFKYAGGRH